MGAREKRELTPEEYPKTFFNMDPNTDTRDEDKIQFSWF
jgi:hypothetical protein